MFAIEHDPDRSGVFLISGNPVTNCLSTAPLPDCGAA